MLAPVCVVGVGAQLAPLCAAHLLLHRARVHGCACLQIALYAGAGFGNLGVSDVVHGQDPWYEMALDFCS